MLRIDRVSAEMDVLSAAGAPGAAAAVGAGPGAPDARAILADPLARGQFSDLVLSVLHEHMRELERRGTV